MNALPVAIITSILIFMLLVLVLPKHLLQGTDPRTKANLKRLRDEQDFLDDEREELSRSGSNYLENPIVRAFLFIPGAGLMLPRIRKAGLADTLDKLILGALGAFLALTFMLSGFGATGVLMALILAWLGTSLYIGHCIKKQKKQFLDAFPDALEMIVRSVRSGYPLTAAISMVGENMNPPVSTEFKRIVDETSYGWTLNESLKRFADRIDEPDVRFFVVMLAVQQESGGNLSEVLSNLARVLRQRKQLRLKIRALSSEGRATAWILGLLPIGIIGAIHYTSPEHLVPLFTTYAGVMTVLVIACIILFGLWMVRKIINIDI